MFDSDVDFGGHTVRNATLEGGSAAGLDFVVAETILVRGLVQGSLVVTGPGGSLEPARSLHCAMDGAVLTVDGKLRTRYLEALGDAIVGGSLEVSGTVVGSGPYVDSSDARLKTNLIRIDPSVALEAIRHLPAYCYDHAPLFWSKFPTAQEGRRSRVPSQGSSRSCWDLCEHENTSVCPARHTNLANEALRERKQSYVEAANLGFLAQDVLSTSFGSHLVTTDADGFHYLAYARFVPLLSAALDALATENDLIRTQHLDLYRRISHLERHSR